MDLSWMLKGSIPTSGFNSKMNPVQLNTSTISQTPSGPLILTGDSATSDASMFQTLAISDSMFSRTHMATPLQDIPSDEDTSPSLYALLLVWTSTPCQELLLVVNHLFLHQTCVPQTLQTSQATSDSQEALEFHLHGFHNEAPSIFQLYLDPSHCGSHFKAVTL